MRFLSMIRVDETAGQVPSEQLMADMGRLIEELTRTGQLVSTAGASCRRWMARSPRPRR